MNTKSLALTDDFSITVLTDDLQREVEVRNPACRDVQSHPTVFQSCGCRLLYGVLLGMQNSGPVMVPIHHCINSPEASFLPTDWVHTGAACMNQNGILTCSPIHITEMHIPADGCERQWLLSVRQQSAPTNYRNNLMSHKEREWRGNVLVVHECGLLTCHILEWVSCNLDQIQGLLAHQR